MANQAPAVVTITAADINGNSIAKTFNGVRSLKFDYVENTVNIVDATGSFYFGYSALTAVTITIAGGITTVVIS